MSLLKQRISSPLEAGTSILDSQSIPPYFTDALEYISKRLARKALHVTLVVVRKEYQVPSSCATPTSSSTSSPTSFEFAMPSSPSRFASPVAGLRQLVRRGTNSSLASVSSAMSVDSGYGSAASSAYSPTALPHQTPRRWPATPGSPPLCTPMTPHTPSSVTTGTSAISSASAGAAHHFGIRLVYATPLSAKDEKTLRATFYKAERKHRAGPSWLPPATTAAACGLSGDLIRRSLLQNEVLFSAEGLTLLGLDRLYTFKAALSAYARTTLPASSLAKPLHLPADRMMEDAVDELRRLVLANGGRPVTKADLHRRYDWIGVSASALGDVERMYRRAYGGCGRVGAFEVTAEEVSKMLLDLAPPSPPSPPSQTIHLSSPAHYEAPIVKIGTPPSPKGPVLKLRTNFDDKKPAPAPVRQSNAKQPGLIRPVPTKAAAATFGTGEEAPKPQKPSRQGNEDFMITLDGLDIASNGAEEEDGDLTARPFTTGRPFWNSAAAAEPSSSIDEMMMAASQKLLSPVAVADNPRISRLSASSASQRHDGPMTPNGYDDISPITRGEWGFLFAGDGWSRPRQGAVETF